MNKKLTNILQSYCNRLNQYLPCKSQEDVDNLNSILHELFDNVEKSCLYWSRKIFIDGRFDDKKCGYIVSHSECHFIPVYDIEEHIGVKAIYDYEEE